MDKESVKGGLNGRQGKKDEGNVVILDYSSFLSDGYGKVFIGKVKDRVEELPEKVKVSVGGLTLTFEKRSVEDLYIFFAKNQDIYPEYLSYILLEGKMVRKDYVQKGLRTIATLLGRKGIGITQTTPYAVVEDGLTDAIGFLYGSFFMLVLL